MRYPDDRSSNGWSNTADGLVVTVKDELMGGEEVEIPADLVVLVTGMVPKKNET